MVPHDHTVDFLEACRTDLNELTPETAPCEGGRAVVRYLSQGGRCVAFPRSHTAARGSGGRSMKAGCMHIFRGSPAVGGPDGDQYP